MSKECFDDCDYGLVAVKRNWVPEWLWRALCWLGLPWFGQFVTYQPFRFIFTRKASK